MPPTKQRLALFLDGTWNTEDDSTNVLNAYTLTIEGKVEEVSAADGQDEKVQVIQRRYYDRGVGTGVLDNITGGAFGFGLDINVREAYNWLVDHYNEYEDGTSDDIFVFGFSRGAYTARSLMGFIAATGLVERGSPLMVSQLWKGSVFIAQNRDQSKEWWRETVEKDDKKFRRINQLKSDDGEIKKESLPHNDTERLLVKWSRRVRIKYMGIYDTVGAMGLQALGIPGIDGKLANHHNPYPSTILEKCRHALAIDEYRSSFRLTDMRHFVRNDDLTKLDEYKNIISQNWFVGAHSNIGGGYANNLLAIAPLRWILEGAEKEGLKVSPLPKAVMDEDVIARQSDIVDSYADFAAPVWVNLFREKRNYRPIESPDFVKASNTLRPINEKIHPSVINIAESHPDYAPPNLMAYIRNSKSTRVKKQFGDWFFSKDRKVRREWPGKTVAERVYLLFWSSLSALGIGTLAQFFFPEFQIDQSTCLPLLAILAAWYVFVDWLEGWCNLTMAEQPNRIITKVVWNVMLWHRLVGVLAFIVGLITFISLAWQLDFLAIWNKQTITELMIWGWVPLSSVVMVLLLDTLDKYPRFEVKKKNEDIKNTHLATVEAMLKTVLVFIVISIALSLIAVVSIHLTNGWVTNDPSPKKLLDPEILAGQLLFIQVLMAAFFAIFAWVGIPMNRFRKGHQSIQKLQFAYSPAKIETVFNTWKEDLKTVWPESADHDKIAWPRAKAVLHESLWRDTIGFIPTYTLALAVPLWIASNAQILPFLNWLWNDSIISGVDTWVLLIAVTALADYFENAIHFRHIKNYPGQISKGLVKLGVTFTWIKLIGFFAAMLISFGLVFPALYWNLLNTEHSGWRWTIATISSFIFILSLLGGLFEFLRMKSKRLIKE